MSYDISQPVSQGSSGEETAENRRIHEIADELRRRCQLYEAQLRDSQDNVGRFANEDYTVWDLVPRNVLRDQDGDIFIIDAEIAKTVAKCTF